MSKYTVELRGIDKKTIHEEKKKNGPTVGRQLDKAVREYCEKLRKNK